MSEVLHTIALERRLSHKYVGTYKYLDWHKPVGSLTVKVEKWDRDEDGDDACDPVTTTMVVEVATDEPQPLKLICDAIRDTFSSQGCAHDYDCCGCRSTYTSEVAHIIDNKFYVETHSSRNY